MSVLFILIAISCVSIFSAILIKICINAEKGISVINQPQVVEKNIGFWRRQFQFEPTSNQKVFDWIFGVGLPVVCFAFDPIVFKTNMGNSLLGEYKPFAYLLSFATVLAMMAWLIWGKKLKWFSGILTGLFAVSGIISLGIGIILFPFSLIGLIMLIGALGFTPLFTSIVFLRNAYRSFQISKPFFENRVLLGTAILSAMFSLIVPFTVNVQANKFVKETFESDAETIQKNAWKIKMISPIIDVNSIIRRYYSSRNETRKQKAIADLYFELTGKTAEEGRSFGQD